MSNINVNKSNGFVMKSKKKSTIAPIKMVTAADVVPVITHVVLPPRKLSALIIEKKK